jgi:tetratricopeptide (TPR) repeat protein
MAALARVRLQQGRAEEAAVLAEAGTKRWALRSLNWYCWGEALRLLGDSEAAIAKFRQLIEMEVPSRPECLIGWARALLQLGRNDEALAKFAEAQAVDKDNARNQFHWGEALQQIGRTREGDAMIAKAHTLAAKQGVVL